MPVTFLPFPLWVDYVSGNVNPDNEITAATINDLQTAIASAFTQVDGLGAYGDNSHDDTTAIQNAINLAQTQGGGNVVLGSKTYLITGSLQIPSGVCLVGSGHGVSFLHYTGSGAPIIFTNAQPGTPTATVGAGLVGFTVLGNNGATYGLDMKCAQQCYVADVEIENMTNSGAFVGVGVRLTGYHNATTTLSVTCSNNTFIAVTTYNCQYGVYGVGGNVGATDSDVFGNKFIGCSFLGSASPSEAGQPTVSAVYLDLRARQNSFTGCVFQHGNSDLIQVVDAGNTFSACEAQYGNGHAFTFKNTSSGNALAGCTVQNSTFTGSAVSDSGTGNDVLSIGDGAPTTARTTAINGAVTLGATGTALTVTNNVSIGGTLSVTGATSFGAITAAGLLSADLGLTAIGAAVNLNASSNFATNINTGTSTGAVSIGSSLAGALTLASGAASSFVVTGNSLTLETLTSGALILTAAGAMTLTAGSASVWTITGGLTVASALTLSAAGTALSVTNNATIAGVLTLSGAGTALVVTNNATIGGTLAITGVLTAPVADKGGQVFNVKAYGAKGDGVTDDTAAIQAAWAAAAAASVGGVVYYPQGVYLHGAVSLTLHSVGAYTTPVRVLAAPGAIFRPNANNITMYAIDIENFVVGPTFSWEGGQFDATTGNRTGCTGIWTQNGSYITLANIFFWGPWLPQLHFNNNGNPSQSEQMSLRNIASLNVIQGIILTTTNSGGSQGSFDAASWENVVVSLAAQAGCIGISQDANSELSGCIWDGVTVYLTHDTQTGFDFAGSGGGNEMHISVQGGPYSPVVNPPTAAYAIIFEPSSAWGGSFSNANKIVLGRAGIFAGTGVQQVHVQAGTGTGYTSGAPTVTIAAPVSGATAVAQAVLTGTTVNQYLTIIFSGYGYSPGSPPAVTFSAAPLGGITAVADSVIVASDWGVHNISSYAVPVATRDYGFILGGDGRSVPTLRTYDQAGSTAFEVLVNPVGNVTLITTGGLQTDPTLNYGFQFLQADNVHYSPAVMGQLYLDKPGTLMADQYGGSTAVPLTVNTRDPAAGHLTEWQTQGTLLAFVNYTGGFSMPTLSVTGAGNSTSLTADLLLGGTINWTTDAAGDIGTAAHGANSGRPGNVYVATAVRIVSTAAVGSEVLTVGGGVNASGLITGTLGLTISGAAVSLNHSSNFNTVINDGTSTGTVTIGNSAAGAVVIASGAGSSFTVTNNPITLQTVTAGAINLTAAGAIVGTAAGASSLTVTGANLTLATATSGTLFLTSAGAITASAAAASSLSVASANLTLQTTTSGTLAVTSAGALNLTGNAASAWNVNGANLTISTTASGILALTSAGALNFTGAANSTWDLGAAHTLSLQTTNNGPITTGTGLLTTGGALTAVGLITGQLGLTVSGAAVNLNASSNFAVNIATGTSTGAVSIGNSAAGALTVASGAASSITVTGNNLTLATASSGTIILSSAGAVTVTGNAASTWDLGAAHTLSIQTTNNGAITTGTGLLTVGGAMTANGGIVNLAVAASFAVNVLTGASTGALHLLDGTGTGTIGIGNSAAGALTVASGANSSLSVTGANLTLQTLTSGALVLTSAGALTITSGAASTWSLPAATNALVFDTNTLSVDASNHRIGIGTIAPAGLLDVSKSGLSGTASLTGKYLSISASTFTVSNNADFAFHAIAAPTLAASGATTTTNAYTLYIAGAPASGTNEAITNAYALGVNGPVNVISTLLVGGAATLSSTLAVSGALTASSGGTGLAVTNNMTVGGFIAIGTNPAGTGGLRLANNAGTYARNAGNTADITVSLVDGTNRLFHGDSVNTAGQTYDVSTGNTHLLRVNGVSVVTVAGNAITLAQPVSITAAGTGLAITNNATVGGTLAITGATTFTGGINGNLTWAVDGGGTIGASTSSGRPNQIYVVGNIYTGNGAVFGAPAAVHASAAVTIQGGHLGFTTDNAYDLGMSTVSGDALNARARDINAGRNIIAGGNILAGTAGGSTYIQIGGNAATTGGLRFNNNLGIYFRNAANSGDLNALFLDGSNNIKVGDANAAQLTLLAGTGSAIVLQAIAGQNQLTINTSVAAATSPLLVGQATDVTTGAVTDGYTSALRLTPVVNGANTVTRHNYLDLNNPTGAATITDAAVMRFDAAPGTHKAIRSGNTKTTWTGAVDAWMKVNVNGTLYYLPMWSSPTA